MEAVDKAAALSFAKRTWIFHIPSKFKSLFKGFIIFATGSCKVRHMNTDSINLAVVFQILIASMLFAVYVQI